MEQPSGRASDWRGIVLVAATYFYFLIFAQFGFLKRLDDLAVSNAHLKMVMGAMAFGGILTSLLTPRWLKRLAAGWRLRFSFAGCGAAALLSLLPLHLFASMAVAALIGVSLGTLTVTLVTDLPVWIGRRHALAKIALGTGAGYFLSNIPQLFTASAHEIAIVSAVAMGICIPFTRGPAQVAEAPLPSASQHEMPFPLVLLWFTALVWLDSAMFFILQHAPVSASGAWVGAAHLWRTGCIHLLAALFGAWLLARRGLRFTLVSAFLLLASGALFLDSAHSAPAAWLYPIGISLYSVALVAYPAYLLVASREERGVRAGWIYAIAGWTGSALGIGMAQHLHRVPIWFVAVAGSLLLLPALRWVTRRYWRESIAVVLASGSAGLVYGAIHLFQSPHSVETTVERGRHVYIAEGCIHCHSQYVRPGTQDVTMWGPVSIPATVQQEKPPLIGNRRQGPDLSNVGSRRSALWLRIHLIDPRAVSPHSIMPSYAYLFRNERGDDLVAYLASLRSPASAAHLQHELNSWLPSEEAAHEAARLDGKHLYQEYCTTCHSAHGYARERWGKDFSVTPPNLATATLKAIPTHASATQKQIALERVIKFGVPGTNMPGHEYLPDSQVIAIAREVMLRRRVHADEAPSDAGVNISETHLRKQE
jgi:cytochrome c oxidase cbb3-type subunit 2